MSSAPHSESATPLDELATALSDACDVAVWLTGMPIPDEALDAWVHEMRPKLHHALTVLNELDGAEQPPAAERTQTKPAESPAVGEGR